MRRVICLLLCCMMLCGCGSSGEQQEEVTQEKSGLESNSDIETSEKKEDGDKGYSDLTESIEVLSERYYMRNEENARYFIVLKNNSDLDLSVEANAIAKDNEGNLLGAETEMINAMAGGQEMVLGFYFDDAQNVSVFEYDLDVKESEYAKSYYNDVSVETSVNNDKLIVMITNNGSEDIDNVMPYALFFNNGELFSHEYSGYVSVGAGKTVPVELECFDGAFEDFELYFEAWN